MYITTNLLESLFNIDAMKPTRIVTETNETFDYKLALPGLIREDVDIKAILEKDFFTIVVEIKKDSTFVSEQIIKIVKLVEHVLTNEKSVRINMENGVLAVSLTKRNPITEFKL